MIAPVSGEDYPSTWTEFLEWFSSEEACLSFVERLRWPGGFECPACAVQAEPYRSSRFR
ncbi:transposase, partial [Arthrospira platensis SPKY2]